MAHCDPPQAVADLTDKMVAVIDRAEAASSGFHGPSQLLALNSPRSEAATTHVDEGPPSHKTEANPTQEVQAILAQMHVQEVQAVAIDHLTTGDDATEARRETLEHIILADHNSNVWPPKWPSKSWPPEAVAAAHEALSRKHSWATTGPITATGRQCHMHGAPKGPRRAPVRMWAQVAPAYHAHPYGLCLGHAGRLPRAACPPHP